MRCACAPARTAAGAPGVRLVRAARLSAPCAAARSARRVIFFPFGVRRAARGAPRARSGRIDGPWEGLCARACAGGGGSALGAGRRLQEGKSGHLCSERAQAPLARRARSLRARTHGMRATHAKAHVMRNRTRRARWGRRPERPPGSALIFARRGSPRRTPRAARRLRARPAEGWGRRMTTWTRQPP